MNNADQHDLKLARILEHELVHSGSVATSSSEQFDEGVLTPEDEQRLAKARTALEMLNGLFESSNENPDQTQDIKEQDDTHKSEFELSFHATIDSVLPEKLGKFEIIRELGRGGFAVVLLARDPALDRLVALKLLRLESLESAETRERFEREAKLAAMLSHPSIVPVYETGRIGPMTFIASAYCAGGTLRDWLKEQQGHVSPRTAAMIVQQLADAVQHAHTRGVVHRDIKPANVFFDEDQSKSTSQEELVSAIRISDFGLAKSIYDSSELSRSEALIGTPAYMSPEQAKGETASVGPVSDVYALGVCLYELLTGELPHRKASYQQTLRSIETESPIRPRKINRDTPTDLEAICLKCLEKDPVNRYASAYELEQDLDRFLHGHSIKARRVGPMTRVSRWAKRNPAIAAAMLITFFSLAIGFGVSTWQWIRADRNLTLANSHAQRGDKYLNRIETTVDRLVKEVVGFLREIPRSENLRKQVLSEAMQLQQELLVEESDDPLVIARNAQVYRRMGELHFLGGDIDAATIAYSNAESLFNQLPDEFLGKQQIIELGMVHLELGNIALSQVRPRDALTSTEDAIKTLSSPKLENDPLALAELANAWRQKGICLSALNEQKASKVAFEKAIDLFKDDDLEWDRLPSDRWIRLRASYARAFNSMAIFEKSNGEYENAKKRYLESIEIIELVIDRYPHRHRLRQEKGTTLVNLANLVFREGDYKAAGEWYSIAANEFRALIDYFPGTYLNYECLLLAQAGLGLVKRKTGQFEDARETYQDTISLTKDVIDRFGSTPKSQYNLSIVYANMSNLLLENLNEKNAGSEALLAALQIRKELVKEYPDNLFYRLSVSKTTGRLAMLMSNNGDKEKGCQLADEAFADAMELYLLNPNSQDIKSNLIWLIKDGSKPHAESGKHNAVVGNAETIATKCKDDARFLMAVAEALAQRLVWLDQRLNDEELSQATRDLYVNKIVQILKQAKTIKPFEVESMLNRDPYNALKEKQILKNDLAVDSK